MLLLIEWIGLNRAACEDVEILLRGEWRVRKVGSRSEK